MTKLEAMQKLANAYQHIAADPNVSVYAVQILYDKFHYLRRSLNLADCITHKCNEGYNGRMPTQL